MIPPRWALDRPFTILDLVKGAADDLGETTDTWTARPDVVDGALYPVSAKSAQRAQLLGIVARWEAYLLPTSLSVLATRVQQDGTTYHVRDVQAWPGLVVALLEEVRSG